MIDFIRRRPLMSGFIVLLVLMLILSTFAIVPETTLAAPVPGASP